MRNYRSFGRWVTTGRMWRRLRWALFPVLLLSPSLAFFQDRPQGGEFKITTDVLLVLLDVGVKDTKGGYASGLSKDDFHVFENGVPQKITVFSSGDVAVTVGLVVDNSGSMHSKRADVITAGVAFVEASNPHDQIFVVNFNDFVRRGLPDTVPFSDSVPLLRSALSKEKPEGRTALYDAIAFALRHLEFGQRDKKTLVVVSDGGDNFSKHSLPELMRLIQESRATIYTVGLFDSDDPDSNPGILKRIAAASGGECFLPAESDEIIPICKKIAKDIRNRYTIGYVPDQVNGRAGLRNIRVTAAAPDRHKLNVRTRTGYLLPEPLAASQGH